MEVPQWDQGAELLVWFGARPPQVATKCSSVMKIPKYLMAGHQIIICAHALCRATHRGYPISETSSCFELLICMAHDTKNGG